MKRRALLHAIFLYPPPPKKKYLPFIFLPILMHISLLFAIEREATPPIDLEYATLTQEHIMHLLVGKTHGFYTYDIRAWKGLEFDAEGKVISIDWYTSRGLNKDDRGVLDLQWLPSTVKRVRIHEIRLVNFSAAVFPHAVESIDIRTQLLYGSHYRPNIYLKTTLETGDLPHALQMLRLERNLLFGSLDLTSLPHAMVDLSVCDNVFTGSVNLTKLPGGMRCINLSKNKFSGSLDVSQMPDSVRELQLDSNDFLGPMPLFGFHFGGLQDEICKHRVTKNAFSGELRLHAKIPSKRGSFCIIAAENQFSAIAWRSMAGVAEINVRNNAVKGTLDIGKIPKSITSIDLGSNLLTGAIDLRQLSEKVRKIDLSKNSLHGDIQFGNSVPVDVFLQENMFSRIVAKSDQNWEKMEIFDASENLIRQRTVQLGAIGKHLRYVNLCGNEIDEVKNVNGRVFRQKRVCYDKGIEAQRKPNIEWLSRLY